MVMVDHSERYPEMTTEKQRGAYMNLVNGVFIVSDSLGPVVGGALAHAGQWRWM